MGQIFSEVAGFAGGVCALRAPSEQVKPDQMSAGFYYDAVDKCWRCDGNSVRGDLVFVDNNSRFMLPPFALDNDGEWKLGPDCADWLPVEISASGDVFHLAGVTMYASDHFTSLILVDKQWHLYDGLHIGDGVLKAIELNEMKKLQRTLCYAYYLLP